MNKWCLMFGFMYWLASAVSFLVVFISLEALWMQTYKSDKHVETQQEFTAGDALLPFLHGIVTLPFILYIAYYIARRIKKLYYFKNTTKRMQY
ncbi:MAG: hypothetical protein AB7D29_04645 [Campylobacterales bacterium]